jgi:flagellar biosynthesis protein FlhF
MNVKRFFAPNSRDALAMVKKALGPDAMILSNKAVNGGNEIIALGEDSLDYFAQVADSSPLATSPSVRRRADDTAPVKKTMAKPSMQAPIDEDPIMSDARAQSLEDFISRNRRTSQVEAIASRFSAKVIEKTTDKPLEKSTVIEPQRQESLKSQDNLEPQVNAQSLEMQKMLAEMRSMRGQIQSQLTELVSETVTRMSPAKASVLRNMLAAGFSVGLSRQLSEKLPEKLDKTAANQWARQVLVRNINTMSDESDVLDRGGVFALIGPTGVGKTTTTAKLAARYVMKHGAQSLGLITTDAYRIGGHEQLRIYGKILGVMVHAVKDEADLKLALEELKGKHTILIDTVGVNQRDEMVAQQMSMLSAPGTQIQRLLCLNATSTAETLADVVSAYKGKGLAGCVMTKLDEAVTIGCALDVAIRQKLKMYYVTNGQRVPEDMHLANAAMLVDMALREHKLKLEKASLKEEELMLIVNSAEMNHQPTQWAEQEASYG